MINRSYKRVNCQVKILMFLYMLMNVKPSPVRPIGKLSSLVVVLQFYVIRKINFFAIIVFSTMYLSWNNEVLTIFGSRNLRRRAVYTPSIYKDSIGKCLNSCTEMFCKRGFLKNFVKSTGKHLCRGLFLSFFYRQHLHLF